MSKFASFYLTRCLICLGLKIKSTQKSNHLAQRSIYSYFGLKLLCQFVNSKIAIALLVTWIKGVSLYYQICELSTKLATAQLTQSNSSFKKVIACHFAGWSIHCILEDNIGSSKKVINVWFLRILDVQLITTRLKTRVWWLRWLFWSFVTRAPKNEVIFYINTLHWLGSSNNVNLILWSHEKLTWYKLYFLFLQVLKS